MGKLKLKSDAEAKKARKEEEREAAEKAAEAARTGGQQQQQGPAIPLDQSPEAIEAAQIANEIEIEKQKEEAKNGVLPEVLGADVDMPAAFEGNADAAKTLAPHDALTENATSVFDWVYENRNAVFAGIGVLAVVLIGLSLVQSASAAKTRATGELLGNAVSLSQRGTKDGAVPSTEKDAFATQAEKLKAQEEAFNKVISDAPSSDAAQTAKFQLGILKMNQGKFDESIAALQEYLNLAPPDGLQLFAGEALGYAFEGKGDSAKAAEQFASLSTKSPELALFHKARLEEKAGKKEDARKSYEEFLTKFESSSKSGDVRSRLELLNMPAPGVGSFEAPVAPATPVVAPAPAPVRRRAAVP